MKISKWSYEIEEGPIEPVYVYEAPVRFWHWAQCLAFFMLVVTGFLIGWPPIPNYAETWNTYFSAYFREEGKLCAQCLLSKTKEQQAVMKVGQENS